MTSSYKDGSAQAPSGTPLLPTLLNGYATRPPWMVAGVDYAVGIPAGTTLKNPATMKMSGVSVNVATHTITVTGSNVTLNGYDFGMAGGWGIVIASGATNTVIENSNFLVGANGKMPVDALPGSGNLTIRDTNLNGGGESDASVWDLISYSGTGTFTANYDSFVNAPETAIGFGHATMSTILEYNVFENTQPETYWGTTSVNSVEAFNTIYQTNPGSIHGIELQAGGGSTLTNTTIENNTVVAKGPSLQMSYAVAVIQDAGNTINGAIVSNNYLDYTGAYGPFYPASGSQLAFIGNVNLTTGSQLLSPSGAVSNDVSSITASPASGTEYLGTTITLTLNMDQAEFIVGTPTLTLNDGGIATYSGGSGTNALTFTYTVGATDTAVAALGITDVNLPGGATVKNSVGDEANLSGALTSFSDLAINPVSSQPKVTWSPSSGTEPEGSAIPLGSIAVTLPANTTLLTLTVGAIPVGAILTDGTHSFTAVTGSTSVNVTEWNRSSLAIIPPNDTDFTLTVTATVEDAQGYTLASASEAVTVTPLAPTVAWSPTSASGVEGSAIALGTISDTVSNLAGDSNSLQSLMVGAIPVGATLSDGTHSFTAVAGSTSVNVSGWSLSSLRITPANDTDFTLTLTATVQDAQGNTSSASGSETVTVTPLAPTVAWSPTSASGVEGSAIALGTISDTVRSLAGDSNALQSLMVGAIPVGATLSDGTHSFTAVAGSTSVNVSGWSLSSLRITPANDTDFTLTLTATVQDAQGNTSSASGSETVTVTPLAPTVAWSPTSASGVEGSAIALGTISDTVRSLAGDSNALQSLTIGGIPVGATLGDGTHTFTATTGSTSVNVAGWKLSALTFSAASAVSATLTATAVARDAQGDTSSASASEAVMVDAPSTLAWSPNTESGAERSAIALGSITENVAVGETLLSLMVGAIPVGATLSDGTHSFTAATGSTSVNVAGWSLSSLRITPANDTDFTLTVTASTQDAMGNTSSASASEAVEVSPLLPTVAWSPTSASGVEGSPITLGAISDTVNSLAGDSNSLASLTIGAIPVGATLSDGTHSFTAVAGSTSINVSGWSLSSLRITPVSDTGFTLTVTATVQDAQGNTSSATASEAVTVNSLAPTVAWSPASTIGVEGTAIALGTISDTVNSLAGDSNSLASLTIGAIPVGAILSDGTHSFTAVAGSTSVNIAGWSLSSLRITPANDTDFTLTVTATIQDAQGNTSSATASEAVTVSPRTPTVAWSPTSTSGVEGAAVALGTISDTVNSLAGDSNSLASLMIGAIPVGAILSDGTHSFTAVAGSTSINVSGWSLSSLRITPVNDTNFTLTVTAAVQDAQGNTSSATASEAVTVSPLAPTVAWSPGSTSGLAGTAIALGTISDTVKGLAGDSNSLQSLTVGGIPAGATLSDGTHSFIAAAAGTSVNIAGWNLSSLSFLAASAVTATLSVTAVAQDAQGNTNSASASETVTVSAATSGYADGSSGAPAGTPELPNLFAGDAVRPPWEVAGVDYYVGVPSGTTLKAPTAANLPAGTSLSGQTIFVTANNVTISGFDLSGNGGYGIYINPGVSGTNIVNNNIVDSKATAPPAVYVSAGASNTYIAYNTINGGGANGNTSFGETIYNLGTGLTLEYNFIEDVPQHFVTSSGGGSLVDEFNLMENGGWQTGEHLNFLQFGGGNFVNPIVDFNTFVQDETVASGEGVQMYTNSAGSITNGDIGNNTMISKPVSVESGSGSTAVSYWVHAGSNSQYPSPVTGTVHDNYIDTSSAYGPFYGGLTGVTYSNNINLLTGAHF